MSKEKMKSALQELIIRLQDAEKGYKEIYNATANPIMKRWMDKYSKERHNFHSDLEKESVQLGGDPEVKTSVLGDLHRVFIDIKINNVDDSVEAIVDEVERGCTKLLEDYDEVIIQCRENETLRVLLEAQRWKINEELKSLVKLRQEMLQPVA